MLQTYREHPFTLPVSIAAAITLVVALFAALLKANGWEYTALHYSTLVFRTSLVVLAASMAFFLYSDIELRKALGNAPLMLKIGMVLFALAVLLYIFTNW